MHALLIKPRVTAHRLEDMHAHTCLQCGTVMREVMGGHAFVRWARQHARPPRAAGIRDHMVQAVELKFNCFLLMPVVDAFPSRLRAELEARPAAALRVCLAAMKIPWKKVEVMGYTPHAPCDCAA